MGTIGKTSFTTTALLGCLKLFLQVLYLPNFVHSCVGLSLCYHLQINKKIEKKVWNHSERGVIVKLAIELIVSYRIVRNQSGSSWYYEIGIKTLL